MRLTGGGSPRWTLSSGADGPAGSPTSSALGSLRWPAPVPTRSGSRPRAGSLKGLARYLRGRGIVEISPAHLGRILAAAGLSFQRTRTWKASPDPDYEAKAARVIALYKRAPDDGVVIGFDRMGPIGLRPHAGSGWAKRKRPERQRATFTAATAPATCSAPTTCTPTGSESGSRRAGAAATLGFIRQIRLSYPKRLRIYWVQDNLPANWMPDIRAFAAATHRARP